MTQISIGYSDSVFMETIKSVVDSTDKYKISETFSNGEEFLNTISQIQPAMIILQEDLADMSAYEFISKLMHIHPVPCLVIYRKGEGKIDENYPRSLDYGIVATLELSTDGSSLRFPNLINIRLNILSKLDVSKFKAQIEQINRSKSLFSKVDPQLRDKIKQIREATSTEKVREKARENISLQQTKSAGKEEVIVIGASTGGPKTLIYIISQFPANFPPVLVVQHMPQGFVKQFAERMNTLCRMNVNFAKDGMTLKRGNVYVAPGGYHMELEGTTPKTARIKITDGAKVNFVKPAVDVTLFSAARIFGNNVISVILTGMGHDGRAGTRAVKKMGGRSIALTEAESVIYGMNKSVIDAGLADEILGMDGIVKALALMIRN